MAQLSPEGITQSKRYIAAVIEVLHLATLIHDDVIDEADTRRGIEALHIQKSNRLAIYAGDYLMTYAARLIQKSQQEFDRNPLDAWVYVAHYNTKEAYQQTNLFCVSSGHF